MAQKLVSVIKDMGRDSLVTIEQIDSFVDECINFLKDQQVSQGVNFSGDIFEIESARQDALVSKFSLTVQK